MMRNQGRMRCTRLFSKKKTVIKRPKGFDPAKVVKTLTNKWS